MSLVFFESEDEARDGVTCDDLVIMSQILLYLVKFRSLYVISDINSNINNFKVKEDFMYLVAISIFSRIGAMTR